MCRVRYQHLHGDEVTATAVPVAGTIGVGPIGATVQPRPMVEVDGVSKWFGDVVAVSDVSFALGSGRHRAARTQRRRQVHDAPTALPA